jgi:hypothetical protein
MSTSHRFLEEQCKAVVHTMPFIKTTICDRKTASSSHEGSVRCQGIYAEEAIQTGLQIFIR